VERADRAETLRKALLKPFTLHGLVKTPRLLFCHSLPCLLFTLRQAPCASARYDSADGNYAVTLCMQRTNACACCQTSSFSNPTGLPPPLAIGIWPKDND